MNLLHCFDAPGASPRCFMDQVLRSNSFKPRMTCIYDRFGVPVTRFIKEVIRPPPGKNFALIATKTGERP